VIEKVRGRNENAYRQRQHAKAKPNSELSPGKGPKRLRLRMGFYKDPG